MADRTVIQTPRSMWTKQITSYTIARPLINVSPGSVTTFISTTMTSKKQLLMLIKTEKDYKAISEQFELHHFTVWGAYNCAFKPIVKFPRNGCPSKFRNKTSDNLLLRNMYKK